MTTEIQTLQTQITQAIARLREIAIDPVDVPYAENVSFEVRPITDDDRINIYRKDWGVTTVNYTSEGVVVDVSAENSMCSESSLSVSKDDLVNSESDTSVEEENTDPTPFSPEDIDAQKAQQQFEAEHLTPLAFLKEDGNINYPPYIAHLKAVIVQAMKDRGIPKVDVSYSGCGDSGQVDQVGSLVHLSAEQELALVDPVTVYYRSLAESPVLQGGDECVKPALF